MRHSLAQTGPQFVGRQAPGSHPAGKDKSVPFDYVATFQLTGKADNQLSATINVSTTGFFVAVAVGYSLLPDVRNLDSVFGAEVAREPVAIPRTDVDGSTSVEIFGEPGAKIQLLLDGLNINNGITLDEQGQARSRLPKSGGSTVIARDITHGHFSRPVAIGASKIPPRILAEETKEPGKTTYEIIGPPGDVVTLVVYDRGKRSLYKNGDIKIPGDGHEKVTLANVKEGDTVVVTGAGGSDAFIARNRVLAQPLLDLPFAALERGFRVHPAALAHVEAGTTPPKHVQERFFQLCPSEHLNFLYKITDNGSQRELMSDFSHNVAGLGIANGDRPFRLFPKPVVLSPRSVVLIEVIEKSGGPGTLYFVLQGYKVLGTGVTPPA